MLKRALDDALLGTRTDHTKVRGFHNNSTLKDKESKALAAASRFAKSSSPRDASMLEGMTKHFDEVARKSLK